MDPGRKTAQDFDSRLGEAAKTPQLQGPTFSTAPPRNEKPLEKRRYKTMYSGTMIDELIGSVERAERRAREIESLELEFHPLHERLELQELIEVA
jgi:hypothetical protein